jgi:hypothetical protein
MKFAAWYGIGVGALVVAQWAFFLGAGAVPELESAPWSIGAHIAAEAVMALALGISGAASLRGARWAPKTLLVALGMAIYSEINSPGYFAQLGQWALVGMFAVLLAGAVAAALGVLRQDRKGF